MIKISSDMEPLSVKHIYRATAIMGKARLYLTRQAKDYQQAFRAMAGIQYKDKPLEEPIRVKAECTFGSLRKKDLSNCLSLELDALNGLAYVDDSQIIELIMIKKYKKNDPGIVLEIEEI